jgi:succinylglutamate desuccinylase
VGSIDYPRNTQGEITAAPHPQLQFKDYETLCPGDPLFLTFAGEVITYTGTSVAHPIFIGEAAYLEKSIAMILTEKKQVQIRS